MQKIAPYLLSSTETKEEMEARTSLLGELIQNPLDIDVLSERLSVFPWDYEYPLVLLERLDLSYVLHEFCKGTLPVAMVEKWADTIEIRDDIECADKVVVDVVHILANPLLEGELTSFFAEDLLIRLRD